MVDHLTIIVCFILEANLPFFSIAPLDDIVAGAKGISSKSQLDITQQLLHVII